MLLWAVTEARERKKGAEVIIVSVAYVQGLLRSTIPLLEKKPTGKPSIDPKTKILAVIIETWHKQRS